MINSNSPRAFTSVLILVLFAVFPWFEGGETATGIFLCHTIVLLLLVLILFSTSRLHVPRFLIYFIPFLAVLCISTLLAPYKYAAFLQLLDYAAAFLFAIAIFSFLSEQQEGLSDLTLYAFVVASINILITVSWQIREGRLHGTFANPNDFATFCILLIILGLFQFEHQTSRNKKILIAVLIVLLSCCMALASSRSVFLASFVFFAMYLFNRKPSRALAMGITAVLIASLALLYFRFMNFPDPFQYYRFKIWKNSLTGILEDPYLGVGLNMLRYEAARFNFPADVQVGRFAWIAKSADNQYLQILAETGFLGFFMFLIGWIAIYFALQRSPHRFFHFRYSYIVVSIISFFALPMNNTSVLFLFLFMVLFPISLDPTSRSFHFNFRAPGRIAITVIISVFFIFCVYLPYVADREFNAALKSTDQASVQDHMQRARRYNPFQPYFLFAFVSRAVNSGTPLTTMQSLQLISSLNESIRLNPLEPDFYVYKAKIYARLYDASKSVSYLNEALQNYQLAIEHSPYNVFLRIEYAFFLERLGRFESAAAELSRAIVLEPAYINARYLLAENHFHAGHESEARKEFEDAELYYHRYKDYQPVNSNNYTRNLLRMNPQLRESVQRLIFDGR